MLFSHQKKIALGLAERFEYSYIVSAQGQDSATLPQLKIQCTNWVNGSKLLSTIRFLRATIPILIRQRGQLVVFSHMTEVQSALIAPLTKILRIPHFLWYAHAKKSLFLRFSWRFLTGIITSTSGSCPVKGKKVHYIGQAVDHKMFSLPLGEAANPPLRWYNIGRIDPSKKLELILKSLLVLRNRGWQITFDIYGAPSSAVHSKYFNEITELCSTPNYSSWAKLHGPIRSNLIAETTHGHDGFVHAFDGSLDKTLIEAMMQRKVVVSTNLEFIRLFGNNENSHDLKLDLADLIQRALNSPKEIQAEIISQRYKECVQNHSLESWLRKAEELLKSC